MNFILKANILIKQDSVPRACLADFGFCAITADTTSIASSNSFPQFGTYRWISPELLDPEKFGLEDNRPTKSSDCYALGMVIYEVLGGRIPFYHHKDPIGTSDRPERPQGEEGKLFTDGIWNILQCCWEHGPGDRPKVEDVLRYLGEVSGHLMPPQTIAGPVTAGWGNEEMSHDGEDPSPPQAIQPHPLEGSANKIEFCTAHHSPVPSCNTPDPQPLAMDVNDLSRLEPGGLVRVSRVNFLANVWF